VASPRPGPSSPASPGVDRFPGDPGPGRLYVGTSVRGDVPVSFAATGDLRITMTRRYYRRGEAWRLIKMAAQDSRAGLLPLVSLKPPGRWIDVAEGRHDDLLSWMLGRLADIARPVFLAVQHEPENEVSSRQMPRDWVAMQHHVIEMAQRISPQVTVVPILMQYTFDPASGRTPERWLVPGAAVQGIDLYNPWRPGRAVAWVDFATMLERARAVIGDGPVVVPEFGCHTDRHDLARTRQWFRDAFEYAVHHDVVGMAYFDSPHSDDGQSWVLDAVRRRAMQEITHRPRVVDLRR